MYAVLLSLIFALAANGASDLTAPCHFGQCNFDHSAPNEKGTVKLAGSTSAISDITLAGGWKILGCDSNAMDQDIRIVCVDESSCTHLYQNGAADTLVRLPKDCGRMPFARLVRDWDHEDQSVPENSGIVRRADGSLPVIKGMTLDTNFALIDPSTHGTVTLDIVASSVSGYQNLTARDDIKLKNPTSFNDHKSETLPSVDITGPLTILHSSINCGSFSAGVDVKVAPQIHLSLTLDATAKGTVVPPKLNDIAIITGIDGNMLATIDIVANVGATVLDTGKIPLFEVGLPGLDVPGIFTIGPSLQLNGQAKASIGASVDFKTDVAYQISNSKIAFPHTSDSSINIIAQPTNLDISSDPTVKFTGTLEAHLTPTINLGVDAMKVIKAKIYADVDAAAKLTLTVQPPNDSSNTAWNGNVDVTAGFTVDVGTNDSFLGFFNAGTVITLYSQKWDLFQKTFGMRKRSALSLFGRPRIPERMDKRDGPTCPISESITFAPITSGTVIGVQTSG